MPIPDAKRRGYGWLAGEADIGCSNRLLQQYRVVRRLLPSECCRSNGSHNGLLFRGGLQRRAAPGRDLLRSESPTESQAHQRGLLNAFSGTYVADKGFEGAENHRRWLEYYGADVIHPPGEASNSRKRSWSKRLRQWVAGIRQIVERVYEKLFNALGLWRERPHDLQGLRARLAARVALHNFCIWLNDQLCRPRLNFADLMGW